MIVEPGESIPSPDVRLSLRWSIQEKRRWTAHSKDYPVVAEAICRKDGLWTWHMNPYALYPASGTARTLRECKAAVAASLQRHEWKQPAPHRAS